MKILFISFLIFSSCSQLKKNNDSCYSLSECSNLATKLTQKSYILTNQDFSGKVTNIGNVKWTKENADFLFGQILSGNGYARILTADNNIYQIIPVKDVRYAGNIPSYTASKHSNDKMILPNSADWGELIYKTVDGVSLEIARNIRPLLSRYGRVIDSSSGSVLIIRDNLSNLHQLLPVIRKMDVIPSKAELEKREKIYNLQILREKIRQETLKKFKESINSKSNESQND